MTTPAPNPWAPAPPIDAVTLLNEAHEHLSRGDHKQILAITYPAVVRVGANPVTADEEEWQLVTLHALATAAIGDPARAVEHADAAYRGLLAQHGNFHDATITAQRALAVAQQAAGDFHAAVSTVEQVHALCARTYGDKAPITLYAAADLATALHRTQRCDAGTQLLTSTVETYVDCHGHDPTSIRMLARLGAMLRDCGRFDHAHQLLAQARRLAQALQPPDGLVAALTQLARAHADPSHNCTADAPTQAIPPAAGEQWVTAIREPDLYRPGQTRAAPRADHPDPTHPAGTMSVTSPPPVGAGSDATGTGPGPTALAALLSVLPRPRHAEDHDLLDAIRRPTSGLRQVTVVNPKGGAGKTVAALMLALAFGRARGGFVLAWDNNETQGTLGMRAQPGPHGRTVRDLLADLDRFTNSQARVGDLAAYLRPQPEVMFDVLASDEAAAAGQMMTATAFRAIRDVLARFYKLIIVDTGNNVRADNWQAAIDATDQLVVTMSARTDSAETAARMLDHLDQTGRRELVRRAVAVITEAPNRLGLGPRPIEDHFAARCRAVLRVPYDKYLDRGTPIDYGAVTAASRRAWLRVAAVVARGL